MLSLCFWGQCDNFHWCSRCPNCPSSTCQWPVFAKSFSHCALFGDFMGLNYTHGRALQPDSSDVHVLHWQKWDINCLLNSQNILCLINGAKQHINLWYDTKLGCNISATLSRGTGEWICTSGGIFPCQWRSACRTQRLWNHQPEYTQQLSNVQCDIRREKQSIYSSAFLPTN